MKGACTTQVPTTLRVGALFLIEWVARTRDAESAENQTNQTVSRKHNEHTEKTPEDFPLTFVTIIVSSLRGDKLEDTPKKHQKSNAESKENQRVQYELIDFVEKLRDIHPIRSYFL